MSKRREEKKCKKTVGIQMKMSPAKGKGIRRCIWMLALAMVATTVLASSSKLENAVAWGVLLNSFYVASMYFLIIYYHYGSFPEKQKRLKAIVDAFANSLALCAIILTFVTVFLFQEPGNLISIIASSGIGSIFFGVISGVLLSRIAFPFWDLYSPYKKI